MMDETINVNKNHKDSTFRVWFRDSGHFRDVCSALTGSDIGEDTVMEDITLEDALFMGRINDVSFLMGDTLIVLIEHQSTVNYNMPLRMLIYAGRLYEKVIER
jgi:hypothetical protein